MATIYIVEDDVNIREIERYALKNSVFPMKSRLQRLLGDQLI